MQKNEFYDLSQLPPEWGLVVLSVSMSRISTGQSPQACVEALEHLLPKIRANKVGANVIYTDALYMNFEKEAFATKNKFGQATVAHMRGMRNLLTKKSAQFQIEAAFNFETWLQMYLMHKDFFNAVKAVRDLYDADTEFQRWIAEDAKDQHRELTEEQVAFYIEEHTLDYLLINRQLNLRNDFVQGREEWVLNCYHGKPAKAQIYLVQQDPLKLNQDGNRYKGLYDLEGKKFYDYMNVDLETFV